MTIDAPGKRRVPRHGARRLLWSLLRPNVRRLTLAVVLLLLQQAAQLAGPLLVAYTIDHAIGAIRAGDHGPLVFAGAGYAGCAIAAGTLQFGFIRLSARVGQDALMELRRRILDITQALSLDFHEQYSSGQLTSRATTDIEALRELLDTGIEQIVTAAVSIVYISAILLYLDWPIAVAALAAMLPIYLTMRMFRRRSLRVYHDRSSAVALVVTKITETVGGIRTVQAFRREQPNDAEFATLNARHEHVNGNAGNEMARYVTTSRLVANIAVAALALWGSYRVAAGGLALGVFVAVVLYLRNLYDDPLRLGGVLDSYQSAAASMEKIAALLAQEPGVPDPTDPGPLPAARPGRSGRSITFDHVSFAYRPDREILHPLDVTIAAGQTVAVVGPTGAGKSTLARLMARMFDPTGGRVLLDGVELSRVSSAELRREVVMLPQEAFLFSGTIGDNIEIGRPGAGPEAVERAARAIGAHAFIAGLPDGYQTDVRQRGGRFSAGQRQLISLARAFLADPAVVILDEATSALDIPTERAVQTAMRTVLRGRTALIIAHRLSTVQIADRVLVMGDGHITDDCAPTDLVASGGQFTTRPRTLLQQTGHERL